MGQATMRPKVRFMKHDTKEKTKMTKNMFNNNNVGTEKSNAKF